VGGFSCFLNTLKAKTQTNPLFSLPFCVAENIKKAEKTKELNKSRGEYAGNL